MDAAASSGMNAASGRGALKGVVGFLVVMEFGSGMLQGWYPPLLAAYAPPAIPMAALPTSRYTLPGISQSPALRRLFSATGSRRKFISKATLISQARAWSTPPTNRLTFFSTAFNLPVELRRT